MAAYEIPLTPKLFRPKFPWQLKLIGLDQEYINLTRVRIDKWFSFLNSNIALIDLSDNDHFMQYENIVMIAKNLNLLRANLIDAEHRVNGRRWSPDTNVYVTRFD